MMVAAFLSMVGLFIGISISATRIPFALAEDGMMPKFLVRVHHKWGTPWVAIIISGLHLRDLLGERLRVPGGP